MLGLTVGTAWVDVGRSLREGFFMFWETLWPLVLGFGLAGAVQAFASRSGMERALGDHRPAAVVRAGVFGMASSSCSYAASAMAKSLFQRGADFVSAIVFMFASTNLVVELGIVLAVLMGWQFTAAEFVGGPVMIVLLASIGGVVLSPRLVAASRRRLAGEGPEHGPPGTSPASAESGEPWTRRLRSASGWSAAARYTMADLTMVRKELVIGYAVAGFLATLVPPGAWNALFVHGHGVWTSVENAFMGPVIAFASFVCSIGNVPLAAALWKGGIGFGGVVSFLFADLVAAPLVLIYRRYYGGVLTVRLVGLFWAVMAMAGLAVEAIFTPAELVPGGHKATIAPATFRWDYTTILDIVFLGVLAVVFRISRGGDRSPADSGYAIDPMCGMQVRQADAPAWRHLGQATVWFCSDRCAERFDSDPGRHAPATVARPGR